MYVLIENPLEEPTNGFDTTLGALEGVSIKVFDSLDKAKKYCEDNMAQFLEDEEKIQYIDYDDGTTVVGLSDFDGFDTWYCIFKRDIEES